jgi:soluble lytic murein transglycosylase
VSRAPAAPRRIAATAALLAALSRAAAPPASPGSAAPHPADGGLAARFRAESQALRAGDCAAARRALAARAAGVAPEPSALWLSAFYAHACGDAKHAVEALREAGHSAAPELAAFEDWRLLLLARNAGAAGQTVLSLAAFERLLAEHRESPLWATAVVEGATAARAAGQSNRAADWIARGLGAEARSLLGDEDRRALARLAWQVALESGDRAGQRASARRLLIEFPFDASELRVVDVLRSENGAIDWAAAFSAADLERRAGRLLDLGVTAGALAAIDALEPRARGANWRRLRARALVLDHQPREALLLLESDPTPSAAWLRALAYGDLLQPSAATNRAAQPPPLGPPERQAFEDARRAALWSVAGAADATPEQRRSALRLLFQDLAAAEQHDQALRALLDLRVLDPEDLSGARYLWERGWAAFQLGDDDAAASREAIARWHTLIETYPESRYSRSAQYWTARTRERLGEHGAAAAAYRALAAADTTDFYRRHAAGRLERHASRLSAPAPPALGEAATGAAARAPWPLPPALARAQLLSDLGLDLLARAELDAVESAATAAGSGQPGPPTRLDRQALLAARARLAARLGDRRESLRLLREAFPALGGAHQDDLPAEALSLFYPLDFEPSVRALARAEGLAPALVFAIIHQESGFDAAAVSRSGARGLMQLMPATARELSRKLGMRYTLAGLGRPETSVRLGTAYFRQVLGMFDGNVELALVGYNSGPFRIRRLWHGDADELDSFVEELTPDEPRVYVKRILALADTYRRLHPQLG